MLLAHYKDQTAYICIHRQGFHLRMWIYEYAPPLNLLDIHQIIIIFLFHIWLLPSKFEYGFCVMNDNQDGCHLLVCILGHASNLSP